MGAVFAVRSQGTDVGSVQKIVKSEGDLCGRVLRAVSFAASLAALGLQLLPKSWHSCLVWPCSDPVAAEFPAEFLHMPRKLIEGAPVETGTAKSERRMLAHIVPRWGLGKKVGVFQIVQPEFRVNDAFPLG